MVNDNWRLEEIEPSGERCLSRGDISVGESRVPGGFDGLRDCTQAELKDRVRQLATDLKLDPSVFFDLDDLRAGVGGLPFRKRKVRRLK